MERLLPGLSDDLVNRGARKVDLNARVRWWLGGVEHGRVQDGGMAGLLSSRPLLEDEVRRRVLQLPNVALFGGYDIVGLIASSDRQRILGARVAARKPHPAAASTSTGSGISIPATRRENRAGPIQGDAVLGDLVVDATGRARGPDAG